MDELTQAQQQELKDDLAALKVDLQAQLDSGASGTAPVEPDSAIGRISRMDAMQIQQMAQASQRAVKRRMLQVQAALQRYAAGEYGECAECFDDIGYKRLKARPETPFCMTCQSRRERT